MSRPTSWIRIEPDAARSLTPADRKTPRRLVLAMDPEWQDPRLEVSEFGGLEFSLLIPNNDLDTIWDLLVEAGYGVTEDEA